MHEMQVVDGGGVGAWCGAAVGFTIGAFIFSRLAGLYLINKAAAICAVDALT